MEKEFNNSVSPRKREKNRMERFSMKPEIQAATNWRCCVRPGTCPLLKPQFQLMVRSALRKVFTLAYAVSGNTSEFHRAAIRLLKGFSKARISRSHNDDPTASIGHIWTFSRLACWVLPATVESSNLAFKGRNKVLHKGNSPITSPCTSSRDLFKQNNTVPHGLI